MKGMFAFVLALLISCTAFSQGTQPQATVWVYRPISNDSGFPLTVYMDGRRLATLSPGQFFGIPALPGLHSFNWTNEPGADPIVVPIGADTYLELTMSGRAPYLAGNPVAVDKAMALMSGLRPINRTGVSDPGVIVPAQAIATSPAAQAPAPAPKPVPVPEPVPVPVQKTAPPAKQSAPPARQTAATAKQIAAPAKQSAEAPLTVPVSLPVPSDSVSQRSAPQRIADGQQKDKPKIYVTDSESWEGRNHEWKSDGTAVSGS